jgi:hypothetical protein
MKAQNDTPIELEVVAENDRSGPDASLSIKEIDALIETKVNVDQEKVHALVVGDPFEGLQVLGPFNDPGVAQQIAETTYRDQTWWLVDQRQVEHESASHPSAVPQNRSDAIRTLIALDTHAIEDEIEERIGLGRLDGSQPTRSQINDALASARIPDSFYGEFDALRSTIIDDAIAAAEQEPA